MLAATTAKAYIVGETDYINSGVTGMVRKKTGTKRGRRVLPEQRKKSIVVSVRLAAGQKEELENAAKAKDWKPARKSHTGCAFPPKMSAPIAGQGASSAS